MNSSLKPHPSSLSIGGLIFIASLNAAAQSDANVAEPTILERITVVAQRASRASRGATNLNLAIKDTPQSISVVTSEEMRDFGTGNINDALRLVTGTTVDEWETNRTTYAVRGFDVANTQIDGIGMPNGWGIVTGAQDTFGYEKIELIRGANGLLTGVGNAAGTINFVRKRPTNEQQALVSGSYGSWGAVRLETDYSTPLTDDKRWAGRVVVAHEEVGSYLRSLDGARTFLYGVADGQIGDHGMLTVGYSYQQDDSTGVMWGALHFGNSDGTQAQWSRDASTTQDWTKWDTTNQNAFVEYTYQLAGDWQFKASYNYRSIATDSKLFYAYHSGLGGLDPRTGAGLAGFAGRGEDDRNEHLGEASIGGHFDAFGRRHEVLLGAGRARAHYVYDAYTSDCSAAAAYDPFSLGCAYLILPSFPYPGDLIPEPVWGARSNLEADNADYTEQRNRVFGATRLTLTDRLKGILGFNYAEYKRDGNSFGTPLNQSDSKVSPYAGLTYDITHRLLGYVSYSDLYLPQSQVDASNNYLEPSKGSNIEAGLKFDWDEHLLVTLAVFQAKQTGLAVPTGDTNSFGQAVYAATDFVRSEGIEFETVGKLNDNTDLTFGYTVLELTDQRGDTNISPWVPRRTANLTLRARLPSYTALSFGVNGRWQSDISNTEPNEVTVRQDGYAVLNAFAAWQFLPGAALRFNINNIADEKYINTLRYAGYYGTPREYQATLQYRF